jgi:hypothetical protein
MADLSFRVVTPRGATPGWLRRWLLAPPPGPTFGRKRRARRARGRRIEARRTTPAQIFHSTPEGSGILTVEQWAAARRTMNSPVPYDEADGFPPNPEEEKFSDVLEELSAACRSRPSRQQQGPRPMTEAHTKKIIDNIRGPVEPFDADRFGLSLARLVRQREYELLLMLLQGQQQEAQADD